MFLKNFAVHAQGIQPWKPDCLSDGVPTLKCLEYVFGNVLFAMSTITVLVLFIMFVIGSFNYLISAGNPERVKKAQSTIKFAIIGFVLFLFAFVIIKAIDYFFLGNHGNLFKFSIGE
jgi:amino acid transporter